MAYIISLIALPLLCVAWIIFQQWLAKHDTKYKGYQAGCGGCTRSCNKNDQDQKQTVEKIHFSDTAD